MKKLTEKLVIKFAKTNGWSISEMGKNSNEKKLAFLNVQYQELPLDF